MSHLRMPAEWENHAATWISWPTNVTDWPGKFGPIPWVYAEIVRVLAAGEKVEIIVADENVRTEAERAIRAHGGNLENCRFHLLPTNRSWLRDTTGTAVISVDGVTWVNWIFNGWAKYDDFELDRRVPRLVSEQSGAPLVIPRFGRSDSQVVLEGGAIDVDGEGTLLTSEECLLSEVQCRNPGASRQDYEQVFTEYLGVTKTIWLDRGCAGDDTHGHIDDIARFVAPGKVALSYEIDPHEENHNSSVENLRRLKSATDAKGRPLEVVLLPYPRPVYFEGQRLPASYANFYVANHAVLVPTFNDPSDRVSLAALSECFPGREVVGIPCRDLVLGLGTIHCLTQQQPAG